MKIAGFKKQSLIDYPGHIASVIFTQGCNFRCPYCHNPDLVLPESFGKLYDEDEIIGYVSKYKKILDAVCVTGGEPTLHIDLPDFIEKIRETGLKIKLDSNGSNPKMLNLLIKNGLVDFIAMDIKHKLEFELYREAVGYSITEETFDKIQESIEIIENSDIDYEFRTTIAKGIHKKGHIRTLKKRFGKKYHIQNFKMDVLLNEKSGLKPFSESEFANLQEK